MVAIPVKCTNRLLLLHGISLNDKEIEIFKAPQDVGNQPNFHKKTYISRISSITDIRVIASGSLMDIHLVFQAGEMSLNLGLDLLIFQTKCRLN